MVPSAVIQLHFSLSVSFGIVVISALAEFKLMVPKRPLLYDDVARPHPYLDKHAVENYGGDMKLVNKTEFLERATRVARYSNSDLTSKYVYSNGHIYDSANSNCIQIKATPPTSAAALYKAAYIVSQVVKDMSTDMFRRAAGGTTIGVFTLPETLTSFPGFHYWADTAACAGRCDCECSVTCTSDGRKYSSLPGAGGSVAVVCAENIICSQQDPYCHRYNVLIHEFAHTLFEYGLPTTTQSRIRTAYNQARASSTWLVTSYDMSTEYEYFAGASSIFFNGDHQFEAGNVMNHCHPSRTCQSSQEGRARLLQYDPTLHNILSEIYTNNRPHLPTVLSPCV